MEHMQEQDVQEQTYEQMTNSPLERLVITLAVPSVISLMVTAFYNLADTFFVGQLGTSATAGVGIAYPLMTLIQASGLMFGKGGGTRIAILLGRRDVKSAEEIAVLGFASAFGVGAVLSVIGLIFLRPLTFLLGSTKSMAPYAMSYLLYILIAMPFKASSVTLSSMLRFQGFFMRSMVGLSCGALLNVVLDPIFIFLLHLGVPGAAIATMLSEMFSFCVLLYQFRRKGSIRISRHNLRVSANLMGAIVRGGFPSLLKNGLSSFATVLLNTTAGVYGDAAVAAISIVARFVHVCQTMFFGIGESCQSVCSFNFGAKRYERVLKCFWFCIRFGFILMLLISAVSFLAAPDIVAAFRRDDPEVIRIGTLALQLQLFMLPLIPVPSTAFVMLQGIGKNTRALLVGTGRQGMFLVPILFIIPHFLGLTGLLLAQPISDFLAFLQAALLVKPILAELKWLQIHTDSPVMPDQDISYPA